MWSWSLVHFLKEKIKLTLQTYIEQKVTFTNPKLNNKVKVSWSSPKLTYIEPLITSSDPKETYSDLQWP